MKKLFVYFISLVLLVSAVLPAAAEKRISIVTTIFPIYDWVREIAGDSISDIDLTMLLDNGVDLHSYQPTAPDIVKVSTSDVFIYVGGESDKWVEAALAGAVNKDMKVINLVEAMGEDIKMEEIVEGMEHEHEHAHGESDAHEKEVSTFEDHEVQDRSLSDWAGDWQSAYPFVLDGSLDKGFEHKAESGKMTAGEYKAYYAAGYETDIAAISIDADTSTITYTDINGNTCKSEYKYLGYYIQDWSTGTRAAMYRFEAVDKEAGAPIFIEFNDHIIEPVKAEHFHFRFSNTSFDDIEDPENRWPTFYPAEFDSHEMLEAFVGHDHSEEEHEHEAIEPEDIKDRTLSEFSGEWKSLAPMALNGDLDALFQHEAEEDGVTMEAVRAEYVNKWACDAAAIKVEGDTITFTAEDSTVCSAIYTYAGYTPVVTEDGDIIGVRYQFTTDSADAPKYVQFNDHGHEPGEVEHFHIYFGSESFEALMNAETNPFFVPADLSAAGVMSELSAHDHHDHEHEHEHEEEADEHVWLSLRNAQRLVKVIADALSEADPANAEKYQANAAAYIEKLAELDSRYAEVVSAAEKKTLLFCDRFPFRYLTDDYGLRYYAAFSGCSAESEASFATVVFLAQKLSELDLPAVLIIEDGNSKIAETVIASSENPNTPVLVLNSMQKITGEDVKAGVTYLQTMQMNLEVLKEAVGL